MKLAVRALRLFQVLSKPGWRAGAVAAFFSGLLKLFAPRKERIDSNLALVYPERDRAWRAHIRRQLYEHLAWTVTELLALQRDPKQALHWVESIEGFHWVEEVKAQGRGVLFLTPHFGNWELLGAWSAQVLGIRGSHPFYVIFQDLHDPDVSDLIREYRERSGMELLSKDCSMLQIVRLLSGGAQVGLLPDVSWLRGVRLPFMGHECTNTTGPAMLSILASASIIPFGIYRLAPFRHQVRFFPPLPVPDVSDRRRRAELLTLEINRALEEIITPRPELWFWMHNRWK